MSEAMGRSRMASEFRSSYTFSDARSHTKPSLLPPSLPPRRRFVIDLRRVGRGDRAVFLECRFQRRHFFERRGERLLVVDDDGASLLRRNFHHRDLFFELAALHGILRAPVRFHCERVLLLARE